MTKRYYNQHLDAMCKSIKNRREDKNYPQDTDPCKMTPSTCDIIRYGCKVWSCKAPKQVKSQNEK